MVFFVIIILGIYISIKNKQASQLAELARIKNEYSVEDEQELKNMYEQTIKEKQLQSLEENPWSGNVEPITVGAGTEDSPYIIENPEQLAFLSQEVNNGNNYEGKFFKITNSINLDNKKFTPIGIGTNNEMQEDEWYTNQNSFKGIIDGQNNIITNINIEENNIYGVGLVGILDEGGVIKNLQIYNGAIIGKERVGAVVGACRGTVENCLNKAQVIAQVDESTTNKGGKTVGGIVGYLSKGQIINSRNEGKVIADTLAGGIVGINKATIENCINIGQIKVNSSENIGQAGGIVAKTLENSLTNYVYNSGNVLVENNENGNDITGGIVGILEAGNLKNAYNKASISGSEVIGAIIGQKKNKGIVENTYYTNQSIKGIGSQSDTQDIITIEDSKGVTEKTTENIENLEEFVNWIDNK